MCENSFQISFMISIKSPGSLSLVCVISFYLHCIGRGSDVVTYPSSFPQNGRSSASFRLLLNCSTSSISLNCIAKPMASIQPTNAARDKAFIFFFFCRQRIPVSFIRTVVDLKGLDTSLTRSHQKGLCH